MSIPVARYYPGAIHERARKLDFPVWRSSAAFRRERRHSEQKLLSVIRWLPDQRGRQRFLQQLLSRHRAPCGKVLYTQNTLRDHRFHQNSPVRASFGASNRDNCSARPLNRAGRCNESSSRAVLPSILMKGSERRRGMRSFVRSDAVSR